MKVNWMDWVVVTVLLGAGCAAIYAGLSRALRHAVAERQRETERQIKALALTVKALQGLVAELDPQQTDGARQGKAVEAEAECAAGEKSGMTGPLKPEILATLAAATTTFLGKEARIRSVRTQATEESATAWAQQGRVIVQTSHNLRPNG